jgi:hypothetical protein
MEGLVFWPFASALYIYCSIAELFDYEYPAYPVIKIS